MYLTILKVVFNQIADFLRLVFIDRPSLWANKMRNKILSISDSNMAGDVWNWSWWLEGPTDGEFMLICNQSGGDFQPHEIDPKKGLKDGVDVYLSLEEMMSEAGYSLHDFDFSGIAEIISGISAKLSSDFINAPEIMEEREESSAIQKQEVREQVLAPFRTVIDSYVSTLSNKEIRGGGTGYGNQRLWVKRFIEDFVVANGCLPKGKHPLVVRIGSAGYSGSEHDFDEMHVHIHQQSKS